MKPALFRRFDHDEHGFARPATGARAKAEDAHKPRCGCCEIHRTRCPSRHAGHVEWAIQRGADAGATVVVRNVGAVARPFAFSATPLLGLDPGAASLSVQPATALLQPGQSTPVQVALQNSAMLRACQTYRAEILIRGAWERSVTVVCHVEPDPFASLILTMGESVVHKALHALACKRPIDWRIDRGVVPDAIITLQNAGRSGQTFRFEAAPIVGPGVASASLVLSPTSIHLGSGATGAVNVKLQNSGDLRPGQTYHSRLAIQGAREHRVPLCCFVKKDAYAYCEVEEGEAPTRKRAHHWYDHFQCTEDCLPVANA